MLCYVQPQASGDKGQGVPGLSPFEAGLRGQKENENGRSTALRPPLPGKGQVGESAGSCPQGQLCRWHAIVDSGLRLEAGLRQVVSAGLRGWAVD